MDKDFLMSIASAKPLDMNRLELKASHMKVIGQQLFCLIEVDENKCEGCFYYKETKDAYNTGDSPTHITCESGRWQNCQRVSDIIEYIKGDL